MGSKREWSSLKRDRHIVIKEYEIQYQTSLSSNLSKLFKFFDSQFPVYEIRYDILLSRLSWGLSKMMYVKTINLHTNVFNKL